MKLWAMVAPKKPLEMIEVEDPTPSGTEVVVKTTHCGLCHSDLHLWEGEYNLGGGKKLNILERGVTFPRAPSHEIVGTVVAIGPDVTDIALGDTRIVYPWIGCGECDRCAEGEENLCATMKPIGVITHGGMAERVVVPHPRYLVDPGKIEPGLAATYACSGITVSGAIRKLDVQNPDSAVVLIGAGGLGLAAVAMLRAKDHRKIIVVDVNPDKEAAALDAGASDFVAGNVGDLTEALKTAAGGLIMHAIDFVNNDVTANAVFNSLGKGGKMVLVGVAGGELNLSLAGMVFVPRAIIGTAMGSIQDLKDVVELANSGKLKPVPTERMPINAVNEAFARLESGQATGRIILEH